jgi:hypothetical protein
MIGQVKKIQTQVTNLSKEEPGPWDARDYINLSRILKGDIVRLKHDQADEPRSGLVIRVLNALLQVDVLWSDGDITRCLMHTVRRAHPTAIM